MKFLEAAYKSSVMLAFSIFLSTFVCTQLVSIFGQAPAKLSNGKVVVTVIENSLFDKASDKITPDTEDEGPSFQIFLRKKDLLFEMQYKTFGRFEINVPKGVYDIVLKTPDGRSTSYQRANIFVRSGQTNNIVIGGIEGNEEFCSKEDGFFVKPQPLVPNGNRSKYPQARYDKAKYDSLLIHYPFRMVVKYCKKRTRSNQISYIFALMTYKNIKIYADKVTFYKKTLSFKGSGQVEGRVDVSSGNCIKKGTNVIVNLRKRGQSEFVCSDMRFH